jgi:putative ABC transport system permease protein
VSASTALLRPVPALRKVQQFLPDLSMGWQNLMLHKLRSLLTMLGMIFGVAAVVSMLSIGAGARQQVMAFIEQMGLGNLIVESHEANNFEEFQKNRKVTPGLTFQDVRILKANVPNIVDISPRKRFVPSKIIPKAQRDIPTLYGVDPAFIQIMGLSLTAGRFFDGTESQQGAPVCVLGDGAKQNLFGPDEAVGKFVKADNSWFRVVGVVGSQITAQSSLEGVPSQDMNNLIYIPLPALMMRMENSLGRFKDEIDGVYMKLHNPQESSPTAEVVRGLLNGTHRQANDFSIIVPSELLAEQRRTQRVFDMVMVAIASISLLVGGIGIMNIMLASILERTREIGVRRALGARQRDIIRQFLIEAVLISLGGGLIGILFGFGISRLIALLAGWSTVMTFSSIALAFVFSVSVGLIFGIYPARKAAMLDPVEAIRYE